MEYMWLLFIGVRLHGYCPCDCTRDRPPKLKSKSIIAPSMTLRQNNYGSINDTPTKKLLCVWVRYVSVTKATLA